MRLREEVLVVILIFTVATLGADNNENNLLDEWSVHVSSGASEAIQIAESHGLQYLGEIVPNSNLFHFRCGPQRVRRSPLTAATFSAETHKRLKTHASITDLERLRPQIRVKRDLLVDESHWNDPFWNHMWYLNRKDGLNMNVERAWSEGVTGKGVAVTILDDGIEKDHPDLLRNYDPLASSDINDHDNDPNPRYDLLNSNRHGTRCAGQIAASPNNSMCTVGIAYNAQIGGIRMLDGQVSDAVEAKSLSFNPDHVDIYSSSWGPNDDGKTVDGPGKLAQRAFLNGITRGRNGKGSIFVWASGNGGRYKDNCNCDGYATSIFTITVSSTSESGHIPWYSEPCASTLAATYSSGATSERQIVTTDLHHGCTMKHTGTSASAPMAAAIIALTLEANRNLTWRDVQHLMVRTSRSANLQAPDWNMNAMGRLVSHSYGYGLMDTAAMVRLAKVWKMVPTQQKCVVDSPYYYKIIPFSGYIVVELNVTNCQYIQNLEHVVSRIHLTAGRKRGDLRIYLISPMGTRSTLLDIRPQDFSTSGFTNWPFMSVHFWGENPTGTWRLEVHNDAYNKWISDAKFLRWSLHLYGTRSDPNSHDKSFNVIREVPKNVKLVNTEDDYITTPETTTTISPTTTIESVSSSTVPSGCVSKQQKCTRNIKNCRIFKHRSVANIFCRCTNLCLDVSVSLNSHNQDVYNMQCDMNQSNSQPRPFYCYFIPFI